MTASGHLQTKTRTRPQPPSVSSSSKADIVWGARSPRSLRPHLPQHSEYVAAPIIHIPLDSLSGKIVVQLQVSFHERQQLIASRSFLLFSSARFLPPRLPLGSLFLQARNRARDDFS